MTNPHNFRVTEVANKNCRDCKQIIWYNPTNRKFYNDPQFSEFHNCEKWAPKHNNDVILEKVIAIEKRLNQQFLMLQEIRIKLDSKLLDAREGLI